MNSAFQRRPRRRGPRRALQVPRIPSRTALAQMLKGMAPMHKGLLMGAMLVLLSCVATISVASQRITSEQAAYGAAPSVDQCQPRTLNGSDILPGTDVAVSPAPGAYDASARSQISFLGEPLTALRSLSVHGSRSGRHSGRLEAYSQGDGASFVPTHAFTPGEEVGVRGKIATQSGLRSFAFSFVVAHPDDTLYKAPIGPAHEDYGEMQHFASAPKLTPPIVVLTAHTAQATPGDIFTAPYSGPGPSGPMIFDEEGNLVWFDPLPREEYATNLQVQQYGPESVLTWWQGHILTQGFGQGEEMIANSAYRVIGKVHAGNGYLADLHDFHITPRGTAVLTVFDPIECNLSVVGGPRHAAVTDSGFQEIDLATGLVRREWMSLDHVALSETYSGATGSSVEWPLDYFHVNSVDQQSNGRTLISARNTWAMYELESASGQVLERIGGKSSNFKLTSGAATAFQHDASVLGNGNVSVFDNGGVPTVHPQSRVLVLSLNAQSKIDSVLTQIVHPSPPLSSGSQGNVQPLEDGDLFVGWGAEPYFSEFGAGGVLLYDAHWHGSYQSYRAYRFGWTGAPGQPPAIAAIKSHTGAVTVFASWNGDTRTVTWRLLAGSKPSALAPVGGAPRAGFETRIPVPAGASYVQVQALGQQGEVLGTSSAIAA